MMVLMLLIQQCITTATDIEDGCFESPPALFRPHRIVHHLPWTEDDQREMLKRHQAQGFGGFSVNACWNRGYLHIDRNIADLGAFYEAAREMGFGLWLYDELGYPSGTAGGMTLMDNPEYEAMALFARRETEVQGAMRLPLQEGELIAAYQIPITGSDEFQSKPLDFRIVDGHIEAELPDGQWEVAVVTRARMLEGFQSTQTHGAKKAQPYVDLMNPDAVDKFLRVTHDRYAEVLGDDLGRLFFSTFTDEPSTMAQSFPIPEYAVLSWSPHLSALTENRYDETLEAMLPALTSDPSPVGQRARYRYFDGVAELMAESFFGQMQDRCHQYSMLSGGHLLLEESLMAHISLYGDIFRCFRRMDVPGIDMLSSIPENMFWHTARMVSSVAALTGTPYTFSEPSAHVERAVHGYDTDPPKEIMRGAYNRQLLGGINCFNVYYQYDSVDDEEARVLNHYVGRVAFKLTGGHRKARVALMYPIQTVWTRWLAEPTGVEGWYGVRGGPAAAREVEDAFRSISEMLYDHRIEFDYIDAQALLDSEVNDGAVHHGEMNWDILILPECDTLPARAWEQVAELHEQGGMVLALGASPRNSETEYPCPTALELADQLSARANRGRSVHLPEWTPDMVAQRLVPIIERLESADDCRVLRTTHRVNDGEEVLFVINDSEAELDIEMTLPLQGDIERLDPWLGIVERLDGPVVQERFEAYGGMLYRAR